MKPRIIYVLLLFLLSITCDDSVTSIMPEDKERMIPPIIYRTWWHDVELCSGKNGDFDAVTWYVTPQAIPYKNQYAAGLWDMATNSIIIDRYDTLDAGLVRHEMLHAILHTGFHPPEYFQNKCAKELEGSFGIEKISQ
jgi:hypothetical protein